jgi:predicted cobalt transporter CbtA
MAIERRRGLFGALMLAVLLFNVTATTLFIHSHTIEGTEIVHSHPYNHSGAHSHTRGHILLLNDASIHDALIVESVACCEPYTTEIASTEERLYSPIIERTSLHCSLRAPPAKA